MGLFAFRARWRQRKALAARQRAELTVRAALAVDDLRSSPFTIDVLSEVLGSVREKRVSMNAALVTEAEFALQRAKSGAALLRRRDTTQKKMEELLDGLGGDGSSPGVAMDSPRRKALTELLREAWELQSKESSRSSRASGSPDRPVVASSLMKRVESALRQDKQQKAELELLDALSAEPALPAARRLKAAIDKGKTLGASKELLARAEARRQYIYQQDAAAKRLQKVMELSGPSSIERALADAKERGSLPADMIAEAEAMVRAQRNADEETRQVCGPSCNGGVAVRSELAAHCLRSGVIGGGCRRRRPREAAAANECGRRVATHVQWMRPRRQRAGGESP